jgi:hypothetical protein
MLLMFRAGGLIIDSCYIITVGLGDVLVLLQFNSYEMFSNLYCCPVGVASNWKWLKLFVVGPLCSVCEISQTCTMFS